MVAQKIASNRGMPPSAARAPAARRNGAAGSGTPLCSTKTMRKRINPPYETRNSFPDSFLVPLLRRHLLGSCRFFHRMPGGLIVPAKRV